MLDVRSAVAVNTGESYARRALTAELAGTRCTDPLGPILRPTGLQTSVPNLECPGETQAPDQRALLSQTDRSPIEPGAS
jgi:hypothetical protein